MYDDRYDAGNTLANLLSDYKDKQKKILTIPNGGVPVGGPIVKKIGGKMGLIIVRKLQIPYNPEAGFGAVTMDGTVILNQRLLKHVRLTRSQIDQVVSKTKAEIKDRINFYNIDYSDFGDKIRNELIIICDDGLASGFTMLAALKSIKKYEPKEIIVAVPTSPRSSYELVSNQDVEVICPNVEDTTYFAVANAYKNWYDLKKEEVLEIINDLKEKDRFF
ncbi:MAG: phosphoribosyltransferase [Candidatus Lokiarchaeota archaeon]|nr:phosphoribosyltransferase [Candidatus Lokiarchaeota archaeon]